MELYGRDVNINLLPLVKSGARHRLAVLKSGSEAIEPRAVDLGLSISEAIEQMCNEYGQSEAKFQMLVAEAVERIIKERIFVDDELGNVVVMENVGILFEPELHIDVVGLLRRISKNTLTVLSWPGEMDDTGLHFLEKGSKYVMKQTDINYTII